MLELVGNLISTLNTGAIDYCHWKSNNNLDLALTGETDIDLLVDNNRKSDFQAMIRDMGFQKTSEPEWKMPPSVFHNYGMDEVTGALVHLHIYFEIITAGSIFKNHRMKLEEMYFQNCLMENGVKIPCKEVELILLVLRKYIEHTSIIELYLLLKDLEHVKKEMYWLLDGIDKGKIVELLQKWLPNVSPELFFECLDALQSGKGVLCRIKLGLKIRKLFLDRRMFRPVKVSVLRSLIFAEAIINCKLFPNKKERKFSSRGGVIAFVGPEASGKSTLAREVSEWLGKEFKVSSVHCGKPPATVVTYFPKMAIKCYVFLKRVWRTITKGREKAANKIREGEDRNRPHPIVSLIDAYDRLSLVKKIFRQSSKGTIVITDRYPSGQYDCIDGPRISPDNMLLSFLSKIEWKLYKRIPLPTMVIKVTVPLDMTLERNSRRENPEPEGFLRDRYEKVGKLQFHDTAFITIDNSGSFDESFLQVKRIIWNKLVGVRRASEVVC